MSDYMHQKVLRIPVSKEDIDGILNKYDVDSLWELEDTVESFGYCEKHKFQKAPTESDFIDYVLESDYEGYGDFGKVRELTAAEKAKYEPIFTQCYEFFDIDKVRLVEYCWYNCCEAPDYYDLQNDSFYDQV